MRRIGPQAHSIAFRGHNPYSPILGLALARFGAQRARIAFRPREDPFWHVDVHYGLRLCTPWYVWLDPAVLQGANPLG